jgi:hypothetical protein
MPLRVSSSCAHCQEVKIVLYSLWYHHTETSEWSKITKVQFYKFEHIVVKFILSPNEHNPMFDLLHAKATRHNPPDA